MARSTQEFAKPGLEECPICLLDVAYVKVLPCTHSLCELCLTKLTQQKKEFPCHVCRKVCKDPDQAINKYFGSIKCSSCLKLKDVDEFSWCCECERLICYRCLTKEHGFDHKLLEWSTKESYEACFKGLSAKVDISKEKLEQSVTFLLKPVVARVAEKIQENSKKSSDAVSSLAQSFGIPSSDHQTVSGKFDHSRALQTINTLATISRHDIPEHIPNSGIPSEIKNVGPVLRVILDELEFSQELPDFVKSASSQTDGEPAKLPAKKPTSSTARSNSSDAPSKYSDGLFVTTKHEPNFLVSSSQEPQKFGPFNGKPEDRFVIGPRNSFAVISSSKVVVFIEKRGSTEGAKEWITRTIASEKPDMIMVDLALDGHGGIHIVSRTGNTWFYFNKTSGYKQYSFVICTDRESKFSGASLCSTIDGIPYLFMNSHFTSEKSVHTAHDFFKFYCTEEGEYDRAIKARGNPFSTVQTSSAIQKSADDTFILGADTNGIHILLDTSKGLQHLRYVRLKFPILCVPGELELMTVVLQSVPDSVNLQKTSRTKLHTTEVKFFKVDTGELVQHGSAMKLASELGFTGIQGTQLMRYIVEAGTFYRRILI